MIFTKHKDCFVKLLENSDIQSFLKRDSCGALCDKYHLAIVFQFFMRANFTNHDYTVKNFFLILSLSHDLYDECPTLKSIILANYLCKVGPCNGNIFYWDKLRLFERMKYRGFVNRKVTSKLCELMQGGGFDKSRKERHSGILRSTVTCGKCMCPKGGSQSLNVARIEDKQNKRLSLDKLETPKIKRPKNHFGFFHGKNKANVVVSVC
ncbi:speedy protein C-like isoform X2 [Euwallacea fornicatus]|uniref:speedy protein C-like isoform X2 n=1 Tax=Euwallacea fornicatus TaxID=995702 RepID=UPI00339033D7